MTVATMDMACVWPRCLVRWRAITKEAAYKV